MVRGVIMKFQELKKSYQKDGVWLSPGTFACAWRQAKNHIPCKYDLEWHDNRRGSYCELELEGFQVYIQVKHSNEAIFHMDWLGEFTDRYQPGCIKRHNAGFREYKYFLPANDYASNFKSLRNIGLGKSQADILARKYIRQDYERAEKVAAGEITELDIVCTVSKNEVELGRSFLSTESDNDMLDYEAASLIDEALGEAKATLHNLCSCSN